MATAQRKVGPRSCIEDKPTHQSIRFGGRFISLIQLAEQEGLNHSYLSRIFSGERRAGVDYLERIAGGLGMGLEEFRASLKELIAERTVTTRRRLGLD